MYRKHIIDLMTVSVKYFFDLDLNTFKHSFIIVLVIVAALRLFMQRITLKFHDGLLTVKEDAIIIKHHVTEFRKNWQNSDLHDHLLEFTDSVKTNLLSKMSALER